MIPLPIDQIEPFPGSERLRILVNSFPKAGTHLLLELIRNILGDGPWLDDRDVKSPRGDAGFLTGIEQRIAMHQSGFAMKGHIPWSPRIEAGFEEQGLRVLLIVRDLRDVACSTLRWMRDLSPDWSASRSLLALPDDDCRLLRIFEGLTNEHPFDLDSGIDWSAPLPVRYDRLTRWADHLPAPAVIRYEDLLGANGDRNQHAAISGVLNHLGLDADQATVDRLAKSVFNPGAITFHTGSAGGWETEFSAEHRRRFIELGGDEANARFGYLPTR